MPTTPYMGLTLPTVTETPGPEWAGMLNLALSAVDSHDHSAGKGNKITPLGLNINSDLSFGSNNINSLRSARFINQLSTLNGTSDIRSIYVSGNNLYYNNEAGTPVRIITGEYLDGSSLGGLTANRVTVTDNDGQLIASDITDVELGYLDGVTSSIQDQLDGKVQNPMTTEGDMIYQSSSNDPERLQIGQQHEILKSDGSSPQWGMISDANIASDAAISQSKLSLSISNSEIASDAAIAYSKLSLTGSIVDADISNTAAITYSKLSLTGSIVDADISNTAAISRQKIATGEANHVLINDGSGNFSSEVTLSKSRGGSGQDNSSLTFPASGTLATLDGSESFSNKSFSDAITLTEQNSTPATPTAGNKKLYAKNDGRVYTLDSSGIEREVGSGVYSESEYLAATSEEKTHPASNNVWLQMTGNKVTLTQGSWVIHGVVEVKYTSTYPQPSDVYSKWATNNGTDTITEPTVITVDAGLASQRLLRLNSTYQDADQVVAPIRVTVATNTDLYLVPRIISTTPSNVRVKTHIYAEKLQ